VVSVSRRCPAELSVEEYAARCAKPADHLGSHDGALWFELECYAAEHSLPTVLS
jgi:hypothetical protein